MTIALSFALSFLQSPTAQSTGFKDTLLGGSPIAIGVLVLLLLFSIYSWTIIVAKWFGLRRAESATREFLSRFRATARLTDLYSTSQSANQSPVARVFLAGYDEITSQLSEGEGSVRNVEAINRVLQSATISEVSNLEQSLTWLATTANASPFIGLFGTVVGIIIAFNGLSTASASSIQAVAPGISQALVATAAGIAAAVPAAIFYNYFLNRIKALTATIDRFTLELLNLIEHHYIKASV